MRFGGTDRGHDTLSDARNNGFFAGPAHKTFDIGPHRDTGNSAHLYAVFGHRRHRRRFDNLRVDGYLHGLEHVPACKIYGRRTFEGKIYAGLVRRDQRIYHLLHIPLGQIMRLELRRIDIYPRLVRRNERFDDRVGRHLTQPHPDQITEQL